MSKNKLHEIITESFINDKIDMDRFLKMSERVDSVSENKAEEILTEISWKSVAVVGGLSLVVLLGIWADIQDRKKRFNIDWKKCRDKCIDHYGPKIAKAKSINTVNSRIGGYGLQNDIRDLQDDFLECKDKCDEIYYKKLDEIKKKKKEVKAKIEQAKKEIKRRKEAVAKKSKK